MVGLGISWELPLGIVVGIIVSFVGYAIIEYRKSTRFKKNVKRLIRIELEQHLVFLKECIKRGTDDTKTIQFNIANKEMRNKISTELNFDGHFFKFQPTNYANLSVETKSQVFDSDDVLIALENAYDKIKSFYMVQGALELDHAIYFHKGSGNTLEKSIEDALKVI